MNSQPKVYLKNNPADTYFLVNSGFTFNKTMSFGQKLKQKMDDAKVKAAELHRRSGVSKQYIGKIIKNTPHSVTEAPPKPEPDIVEKLAKGIEWDVDDALLAAGYAPKYSDKNKANETTALLRALNSMTPEKRDLAIRIAENAIKPLIDDPNFDFNYVDDEEK